MTGSDESQRLANRRSVIWLHLARVAREGWGLSEEAADEFAFHMTDWLGDLEQINAIFAQSESDSDVTSDELMRILVHVPNHLAAAAFIATGFPVTDVFELGAVQGDGVPRREPGGDYPRGA